MRELIEKIERAEGPSRELDAAIAVEVLGYKRECEGLYCDPEGDFFPLEVDYYDYASRELPHFTASIDVALTLVPSGAFASDILREAIQRCLDAATAYGGSASLMFRRALPGFVTAAALRAKESEQ